MKRNNYTFISFLLIFSFLFTLPLQAQLQLPQIFSNGVVLQRDNPIPVWGKSTALDTIIVTLDNGLDTTIADESGNWQVELSAMDAGGPYTMLIQYGQQMKTISNVYIGDVWLASGQSNMEMTISQVDNAASVISAANDQNIRQFKIPKGLADEPSELLPSGSVWTPATSAYVGNFTAVGYFFARDIRADLDIPIGIINSSYGGSRIETWMSDEMLGYDEQDTVLADGEPERQPTVAFNKMLFPLLKVPVKGFLWYQGESNADNMEDALAYKAQFQTMINSWRELWGLGDVPFLWVQLPNFGTVYANPQIWDAWPQLRAGQSAALTLPNTGEVITIDVGNVDIHPTNKEPVGERMALVARKLAYGEDIVYSGPRYKSNLLREDGRIEINYNQIGSGLVTIPDNGDTVNGFAVADMNDNLHWANAIIDGDKVLVWNDDVSGPVRVRYAWEYNPATINLYNVEQLPAAPFMVDVNPGFGITTFKAGRSAIEDGQSTTLTWQVFGADNITLDGSPVDSAETITITPDSTTTYLLVAVNRDDEADIDSASVTVVVLDPNLINRALNHPVKASTLESCCGQDQLAEYAVDGDLETRWSSAWSTGDPVDPNTDNNPDDEWIYVDFGESIDIDRVILYWEAAYGSAYNLDVSYDGYLWKTVYSEEAGNGGEDNIVFDEKPSGRFLRIHGLQRATQFGYSLFEIAAYGFISEKTPPSISLYSNKGNVLEPSANVTISAILNPDADSLIQEVSFYADGALLVKDTEAPFETPWQAGASGEYALTAIVMDSDSLTVQSDTLRVYINDNTFVRYEAEDATTTGQATKVFNINVSGAIFVRLDDAWTITWDNVKVPETGEYLLDIGYQLTYGSPKNQYLVVNGDTIAEVEFSAPNVTDWLQKGLYIPLNQGTNTIAFHGFWNWMSFDFIAVKGATVVSIGNKAEIPSDLSLSQNYPNPFNPLTTINYTLPGTGHVVLNVFDVTGKKVTTLVNSNQAAGSHRVKFNADNLASGIYFYNLRFGNKNLKKSMLFIK